MSEDENKKVPGLWSRLDTFQRIKLIMWAVVAVVLIICAISIIHNIRKMHKMGWSFKKNDTEIEITEPEYAEAMLSWKSLDYETAEAKFVKTLESVEAKSGKASIESAAVSRMLGTMYLEEGKFDEAYERLNSAYVTLKKELGEKDGNTVLAKGQIAIYDIKTGNVERGFSTLNSLYDEAAYVGYKLQICQMLAQCNTSLGNYKKAAEWYDILGELYYQFDIMNTTRVNLINDYGSLMMTVGKYQEAVQSYLSAISVWNALGLEEDSIVANVYSNLAQAYAWTGQRDAAIENGEKALDIQKRLFGENNIYVAMSYNSLADMYDALDDAETRKLYLDKALDTALDSVGKNHMGTAVIYRSLGDYHKSQGDMEKAVECHTEALEIRKNILGLNNVNTITIYESLADDYREMEKYDLGVESADAAVKIAEQMYGKENLYSAHSFITAAWLYADAGKADEAAWYARTALEICDRQKDNAGSLRPYSYQTRGYVYYMNAEYDNAVKYLTKAITLYEGEIGDNSAGCAKASALLGSAYLHLKDYENSFKALYNAQEYRKQFAGQSKNDEEGLNDRFHALYDAANDDNSLDFEGWMEKSVSTLIKE